MTGTRSTSTPEPGTVDSNDVDPTALVRVATGASAIAGKCFTLSYCQQIAYFV